MIERFVKVVVSAWLACLLIGVATIGVVHAQDAQQPPAASQPAAPQSSAPQENPEVETPARKVKPKLFKTWTFNVSAGGNLPNGTTAKFVRGGGPVIDAGVARNFSRYFGFRLDADWIDLPLRASAAQLAESRGGTSQVYGLNFDPIFYIPVNHEWSGYALIGPGFYHRTGKLDSSNSLPGSVCNAFWDWWGTCLNGSLPLGSFLKESQNEAGYNFGGGIARKVTEKIDIYGEYRAVHGSHNGNTTDARTLTVGVRW